MPVRLPKILSARSRSRVVLASRGKQGRRDDASRCRTCGQEIAADGHGVTLATGLFHAGCVLYRHREPPTPPPGAGKRLQATR